MKTSCILLFAVENTKLKERRFPGKRRRGDCKRVRCGNAGVCGAGAVVEKGRGRNTGGGGAGAAVGRRGRNTGSGSAGAAVEKGRNTGGGGAGAVLEKGTGKGGTSAVIERGTGKGGNGSSANTAGKATCTAVSSFLSDIRKKNFSRTYTNH